MFEPHGYPIPQTDSGCGFCRTEAAAAGGAGDVHHRALRRFGARRCLGSVPRQHAVAARHHVSDLKTFAQVVGSTRVPKSID